MTSPVTQGSIARLLQEGVNAVAQTEYNQWDPLYAKFLSIESSDKAYEIDVSMAGIGAAQLKPEGADIQTEGEQQLYSTIYQNRVYAKGTIITYEAIKNNQYQNMMEKGGRLIARSLREAEELVSHDLINDGYDSGVTFGDGVSLFNTAHLLKNGTFSNMRSTYAQLSEASLEDACISISKYKDPAGLRINMKTKALLIPVDLEFEAMRILRSSLQNDTGNNAINALASSGKFPGGIIATPYLSDAGAWTVCTDVMDGGKFFRRMDPEFRSDNSDTNTLNYRHVGITYFSVGNTDPRAFYGSGASV